MDEKTIRKMEEKGIKPISEYEPELPLVWFVPRKIEVKKTRTGKNYLRIKVIDSTNTETQINCWNYNYDDNIELNKPYLSSVEHNDFGFSVRNIKKNFRLIE